MELAIIVAAEIFLESLILSQNFQILKFSTFVFFRKTRTDRKIPLAFSESAQETCLEMLDKVFASKLL